ncbi:MAG: putative DNA-binding protein [Solirubrobacterales bacterium]
MDDRIKLSILIDLYGVLLTDKQRDIMNLYYNDDLSLAEIGEITNTSRQAVFDIIKRCDKLLLEYEEKLCLLKNEIESKLFKENLLEMLELVDNNDKIEKIKKYILENI